MSASKLFSYETFVHAVAGAAGGSIAMSIFFPLDTVRSRLQVEDFRKSKNTYLALKDLIEEEGIKSLYRGIHPILVSLCCSNFVYFYTFHGLRTLITSKNIGYNVLRDLLFAGLAGAVNVIFTTPLWVVNSRLKMQGAKLSPEDQKLLQKYPKYNGIIDALIKITATEGWTVLWSSLLPSLMLIVNPAIQFTIYEAMKMEFSKVAKKKELNSLAYFLLGAVAKCISTILTYPLQVVQSKLRYGSGNLKKMNIIQVFSYIIKISGIKGLYKGLEAKLLHTVLTAALMFLCYEKIASFVFHIMRLQKAE